VIRWYVTVDRALVEGPSQRGADALVLPETGVQRLHRRVGGGFVLLDSGMLCLTVVLGLPHALSVSDVTESYRWLGETLAEGLRAEGVQDARVASVVEARAHSAVARFHPPEPALKAACYAGVSPYEVMVGDAKIVGLAQARSREAALFQVGILLRDQSDLADLLVTPDRVALRGALRARTMGLETVLGRVVDPEPRARRLHAALLKRL